MTSPQNRPRTTLFVIDVQNGVVGERLHLPPHFWRRVTFGYPGESLSSGG